MTGKYIFDTNIVIKFFAKEKKILEKVKNCDKIFIPSIVVGELYYGAYNSTKKENNIKRIEQFLQETEILFCDDNTAIEYGKIKKKLKDKGKPIPENDIWIAAVSIQHAIKIACRDIHFEYVDNLDFEKW